MMTQARLYPEVLRCAQDDNFSFAALRMTTLRFAVAIFFNFLIFFYGDGCGGVEGGD